MIARSTLPAIKKISIALPSNMVAVVREAVETGEYASSSEVVRDALRDWTERRRLRQQAVDELRQIWQQARKRRTPGKPAEEVLDRLEHKFRTMARSAGR
ncbi:MAG TPA: type II toxin-antitoxin system ParD family antitoxin [Acidobacteriaceae bacterium]|nr:type II toxin-antitoxin system ParD family antitoxin [Acidobacteriaceae bacterium]